MTIGRLARGTSEQRAPKSEAEDQAVAACYGA